MTREKAIEILKEIIDEGWLISDFEKCVAIDACEMAIKALEQEPFMNKSCVSAGVCEHDKMQALDKVRKEIKDWQVDIHDNEYDADKHDFVFERIFEIIDEYKVESEG